MRETFIAGNWKMFKDRKQAVQFAREFKKLYKNNGVKVAVCAPYLQLDILKESFNDTDIKVGAQNVHYEDEGAFTGEISVPMLEELGMDYCIVGHSERRQYFGDTDETINKKLLRLFQSGIRPILCVGEDLAQREKGTAQKIVDDQLEKDLKDISKCDVEKIVIAYEPIWAIGTGKTATPQQAAEMCGIIRTKLGNIFDKETADKVIIQYGGSVKPANASEILKMEEIDGALVGGASLDPENFIKIIEF